MAYDAGAASFTSVNFLRLLIGDTDTTTYPLFTDAELTSIITRCTVSGTVNWFRAAGICLRSAAVDPDRLYAMKKATSGGVGISDLMDQFWKRATAYLK